MNTLPAIGAGTYAGIKAVDNPQDNTQQYAQGGTVMTKKKNIPKYSYGGKTLEGVASGISAGSSFGPVGMAFGAVLGAGLGGSAAEQERYEQNRINLHAYTDDLQSKLYGDWRI